MCLCELARAEEPAENAKQVLKPIQPISTPETDVGEQGGPSNPAFAANLAPPDKVSVIPAPDVQGPAPPTVRSIRLSDAYDSQQALQGQLEAKGLLRLEDGRWVQPAVGDDGVPSFREVDISDVERYMDDIGKALSKLTVRARDCEELASMKRRYPLARALSERIGMFRN